VTGRSKDQDLIDELAAWMQKPDTQTVRTNGHTTPKSTDVPDEIIIEKCRGASNAAKFSDLFDHGDVHTYHGGDASVADLALLGILTYWTKDPAQLERIFSDSALARREKWRRDDYRKRTIDRALKDAGPGYDWSREGRRRRSRSFSSLHPPLGGSSDDENNEENPIVWFSELGEPKEREYLIEKVGVKGYPIVAFGAGGVAKSFAMLSAGIAIASASGVDDWFGLRVLEHGHVLYLDFELDLEEQHRRVRDLCAGMGIPIPTKLAYLSGVGISPEKAFQQALTFAHDYEAKAVIIDSMGLAMQGDMEKGKEVLTFHGRYINPLRRAGSTPFIVDHEGKLQAGEKHKDKTPFGSAYKAWASRSVLQFVFDEYREEASELDIRVRQTKTNFGPKIEPIGVRFAFEDKKVSIETYELPGEELLEEESKPVGERILAALRIGPASVADLERLTGAAQGTIYNNLSRLMKADPPQVEEAGYKGRSKLYRLFSSSPEPLGDDEVMKTSRTTVAGFFANPPDWLPTQLEKYCENPELHFEPLCTAVAAEVLGDGARGGEVAEEVEKALSSCYKPGK
jgi:AAA domain